MSADEAAKLRSAIREALGYLKGVPEKIDFAAEVIDEADANEIAALYSARRGLGYALEYLNGALEPKTEGKTDGS